MGISPLAVKYGIMGIVCGIWLATYKGILQWRTDQPFHVAQYQRDRRKAGFYMLSVWIGLSAALLGLIGSEAINALPVGPSAFRDMLLAVVHGVGLCGVLMAAAVWSQVGRRVLEAHSDNESIQLAHEERPGPEPEDRARPHRKL
jgi:hypothetical protein